MESAASREQKELLRRQSIQRQIAQLEAQLLDPSAPSSTHAPTHASSLEDIKRKRPDVAVLAPASPEPKKRRVGPSVLPQKPNKTTKEHRNLANSGTCDSGTLPNALPPQPAPSNLLSKLAVLSKRVPSPVEHDVPMRTSSFADKASGVPARDDRLTLIEQLEPGPYEHKPLFDDPLFESFEPHSGIRLGSRKLPHEDLQGYMTGRYYISPSRLYSVVRAQPSAGTGAQGQVYDVPVIGDWVTIAVVAERSPIRVSRAPVAIGSGEARDADDSGPTPTSSIPPSARNSKSGNNDPPPIAGRKYVNLTLIDFGASGKKGTSRGDAALSLLLFESDSYDTVSRGGNLLPEKIYKGGSRGAFESMAKLREGSVIALLNPRVLKPLQKPGAPNILALTPESATSVAIIGTSRDLGMCGVVKRDGKPCGSWCDKRVSDVCEYHVQHAVERRRAGRPEFSVGTSGLGVGSSSQKRKATYDPQRKWGLSPAEGTAGPSSSSEVQGATYVVAGHVVASGKRDLFVNENIGREAQARASRLANSRDTDAALKRLLARDKEGMRAVQEARKFAKNARDKQNADNGKVPRKDEPSHKKRKKRGEDDGDDGDGASDAESGIDEECASESDGASPDKDGPTKNAYSARVIKELGFDPTALKSSRGRRKEDEGSRSTYTKLAEAASCRDLDKIRLGPKPGGRVQSVVSAPKAKQRLLGNEGGASGGMVDLDESSEDEPDHSGAS